MIKILSKAEIFRRLAEKDLSIIADISTHASFSEKEVLIKEGQINQALYIIVSGIIEIFLPKNLEWTHKKRVANVKLNTLRSGECFGEYSVLDNKSVSATVMAQDTVNVIKIPGKELNTILKKHDYIGNIVHQNLLRMLVNRLRKKDKEYDLIMLVGE